LHEARAEERHGNVCRESKSFPWRETHQHALVAHNSMIVTVLHRTKIDNSIQVKSVWFCCATNEVLKSYLDFTSMKHKRGCDRPPRNHIESHITDQTCTLAEWRWRAWMHICRCVTPHLAPTSPIRATDRLNLKHGRQCAQSSRNEPQNVTPQVLRYPLPDLLTERSLYDSGKYTDLLITCGSDTYKVHRSVVCNRSGFFERAERFPVSAEKVR
jgi:hypothetical protein